MYFEFQTPPRQGATWVPNIDVCERPSEIIILVEMPGVERTDVQLSWLDGMLVISGLKRQHPHHGIATYLCVERAYGHFRREITINVPIDQAIDPQIASFGEFPRFLERIALGGHPMLSGLFDEVGIDRLDLIGETRDHDLVPLLTPGEAEAFLQPRAMLAQAFRLARDSGDPTAVDMNLVRFGHALAFAGKIETAVRLLSLAESIHAELGWTYEGWFLAINLESVSQDTFEPLYTFLGYAILILGGLANFWGVMVGSVIFWTLLEGMRFVDLPLSGDKVAALRFILVGLVLILLMAFRPQGVFGKKEEMVLGE